jgi:hypothetical protein
MPGHDVPADVPGDHQPDDADHQQPVEQAGGEVPNTNAISHAFPLSFVGRCDIIVADAKQLGKFP